MHVRSALTCLFLGEARIGEDLLGRLGDRGVRVVNAASGRETLQLVDQFNPAVIVLGGGLKDFSTREVYRHLKLNLQRNIPIVLLYDPAQPESRATMAAPGDQMLVKPVDPEVLGWRIYDTLTSAVERNDRISIGMDVECLQGVSASAGFARNISEGGIFVETDHEPWPGNRVTMSLRLSDRLDPFQRQGRIVHCKQLGRHYRFGMGVQFFDVKFETRQLILAFLSDKLLPVHV